MKIVVNHPVPSWNEVLGMSHWERAKFKKRIQDDFLSELRASASGCSTRTTFARSTMLTASVTLASYQVTRQAKQKLKLRKYKSNPNTKSAQKLNFLDCF